MSGKVKVTRTFIVTIPDDTPTWNRVVSQMEEDAKMAGIPMTAEDFEPQVLRGDMARFLVVAADGGNYTDLVEELDSTTEDITE